MATDDAPATKRDLEEAKAELQEQMRSMQSELQEQIRDMQTEILKAFLPWQENVHVQFEELKFNTRNSVESIRERITIVERRLFEIEKKLLMNPPAA